MPTEKRVSTPSVMDRINSLGNFDFKKNKRELNNPKIYDELISGEYAEWFLENSELSATECRNYWSTSCSVEHLAIRLCVPAPGIDDVVFADFYSCDGYYAFNFTKVESLFWEDYLSLPKDYPSWIARKGLPDYAEEYIQTRDKTAGYLFTQQYSQWIQETSKWYWLSLIPEEDFQISHSVGIAKVEKGIQRDIGYLVKMAIVLPQRPAPIYLFDRNFEHYTG
jgi:hypothetical protein